MPEADAGWTSRFSIQHRLLLSFGGMMLMLAVICSAFFWAQRQESAGRSWVTHTYEVILELQGIESAISDQRLALRDYLINGGHADRLQNYNAGVRSFDQHLEQLLELTADSAIQQSRLAKLQSLMTSWTDQFAVKERELGARTQTRTDAEALLSRPDNYALMGQIIGLISTMEQTERTLLLQRTQRLENATRL